MNTNKYRKRGILPTLAQSQAFRMCLESQGIILRRFISYHEEDDAERKILNENDIYPYMEEPIERYELKGNQIIRTVSTFHYLSQCTKKDGKCNSFRCLQRKFIKLSPLHGKEEIEGVHDVVWRAFNIWYHVGKMKKHFNSGKSDLDIPIQWVEFYLSSEKYYLVRMLEGDTTWHMFAGLTRKFSLNPKTPLIKTQEEIIQDLKDFKIDFVYEYGNPKNRLWPIEVLRILLPLEFN